MIGIIDIKKTQKRNISIEEFINNIPSIFKIYQTNKYLLIIASENNFYYKNESNSEEFDNEVNILIDKLKTLESEKVKTLKLK